jgi:hypothetical protein
LIYKDFQYGKKITHAHIPHEAASIGSSRGYEIVTFVQPPSSPDGSFLIEHLEADSSAL